MKICYLFSDIDKSDYTAQPGIIYRLAIEACNYGHDVYIVSNMIDNSYQCDSRISLLNVIGEGDLPTYLKNTFKIYRFIKRIKPDLIHVHGMMFAVYIWVIAKILGIKIIVSTCETIEMYPKWLQKKLCNLFSTVKNIIVTSEYIKNKLIENNLDNKKIIVSRLGLREQFCRSEKNSFVDTDILFWGDASIDRGFDHIVKLIKSLPEIKFKILLRWKKSECDYLLKDVSTLHNAEILVYPYVKQLNDYIKSAKVIILPFKWMGVRPPLSIIEAMAVGKCVLTSEMGGTSEIINDTVDGYTVDFSNISSVIKLVKELLENDKKRAKIAEAASQKIADLYNDHEIFAVLKIYHEIKLEKYEQSNQSV